MDKKLHLINPTTAKASTDDTVEWPVVIGRDNRERKNGPGSVALQR